MSYFYISFVAKPKGCLGGTVVSAADNAAAIEEATRQGINPGGEAVIAEIPTDVENDPIIISYRNRLVSPEELLANGGKRLSECDVEVNFVCAECNNDP